jgi:hypothetical protein
MGVLDGHGQTVQRTARLTAAARPIRLASQLECRLSGQNVDERIDLGVQDFDAIVVCVHDFHGGCVSPSNHPGSIKSRLPRQFAH